MASDKEEHCIETSPSQFRKRSGDGAYIKHFYLKSLEFACLHCTQVGSRWKGQMVSHPHSQCDVSHSVRHGYMVYATLD